MRNSLLIACACIITSTIFGQNRIEISDMQWGADFNIHITFSNDSSTIHDIKALHHSNGIPGTNDEVTYYPVSLDPTFIQALKNKKYDASSTGEIMDTSHAKQAHATLWSSLHPELGGGYIHFINCLIYAFESGNLNLSTPLMTRPVSNWKPNPVTQSYVRTKKWKYFVPDNQKLAQKEFKLQQKNNELGDIMLLPSNFIELFLSTSQKEYRKLVVQKEANSVAIIDVIRLLLGAKYLGKDQIHFIQNAVVKSVMHYNINNLPSVIIFDNLNAAVAMTLDNNGYKIEKIVINNQGNLSTQDLDERLKKIEAVIYDINEANKKVFEKKLKNYYTQ